MDDDEKYRSTDAGRRSGVSRLAAG